MSAELLDDENIVVQLTSDAGVNVQLITSRVEVTITDGPIDINIDETVNNDVTPATVLAALAAAPSAVAVNGQRITGLAGPSANTDAATMGYVDTTAATAAAGAVSTAATAAAAGDATTLSSAQAFATTAAANAVTAAVATLSSDIDDGDAATLTAAQTYAATAAGNALADAQEYTDTAIAGLPAPGGGGGALPLDADAELTVTDAGDDDTGNGTQPFATVYGALGWLMDTCCGNLGGMTATVTDTRADTTESFDAGGFFNGTLVIDGATLGEVNLRDVTGLRFLATTIEDEVRLTNCSGELYADLTGSGRIIARRCDLKAHVSANGCTGSALRTEFCSYVGYEVDANGCTATPVEHVGTMFSELIGDGLTGTNGAAPFAVTLTGGGKHLLTGATMSSSGGAALNLDGYGVSWWDLSNENYENGGTFAYWSDNRWVHMGRLRIINNSSTPYDDLIVASLQYGEYMKPYGVNRPLDPAYQEVTANAAGTQADATLVGRQDTKIIGGAANSSVRMLSEADAPVMGGGAKGTIWNCTDSDKRVYPPSGKQLHYGGITAAVDTYVVLPGGAAFDYSCRNSGDFDIKGG